MADDSKSKIKLNKTLTAFSTGIRISENISLAESLLDPCKEVLSKSKDHHSYLFGKTSFFDNGLDLFKNPKFDNFKTYILNEAYEYLKDCGIDINLITIKPSLAWVSEMYKGGSHPHHSHAPYCQLSGNYWIHAEENSAPLCFHRDKGLADIWQDLPLKNKTIFNIDQLELQAKKGNMAIWKSDLIHNVFYNKSNSRIAISFNLVVVNPKIKYI